MLHEKISPNPKATATRAEAGAARHPRARGIDPHAAPPHAFAHAHCPHDLTPWHETPEAIALLADCAKNEPAWIRRTNNLALTREWCEYDDTDPRFEALMDIRCNRLTPILRDPVHYKRAEEAGLSITVQMAIEAALARVSA